MVQIDQALFLTSADGTKIFAEGKGDTLNPCIVFTHGMSTGMGCFDEIFADPLWSERVFLVRYDIRGHGMSQADTEDSTKWESARFAEDFDAVINHFGVVRPFLAGWSMGAAVTSDIISAHDPTYLAGLIHMSPQPNVAYPNILKAEPNALFPGFLTETDVPLFKSTAAKFIDLFTLKPIKYSSRFTVMGALLAQPGKAMLVSMARPQDPDILWGNVAKKLPLLLILAEHDRCLNTPKLKEDYEREWVDIQTVVLDSGHAVFWDEHDDVREKVLAFVASHRG
ncbi:Alpha/Beta hydrolase protein [Mycena polygramma]|nr:Alpha/Beta hydrolase protein [Mycena polygramma]